MAESELQTCFFRRRSKPSLGPIPGGFAEVAAVSGWAPLATFTRSWGDGGGLVWFALPQLCRRIRWLDHVRT